MKFKILTNINQNAIPESQTRHSSGGEIPVCYFKNPGLFGVYVTAGMSSF